ncbi:MAG: TetR/AcrR family transcriptional regulator C-terminal domain-containing protein [Actinomycetales bacterium]|nr:TetR/AcrR family transcriptional regulator C-terminal domain-containing protein [Actinomycetales bacterium]
MARRREATTAINVITRRSRLSRGRIVGTAIELADRDGLDAISMRRLATQLKVDPMALYHHVDGKDELVDAMLDRVVSDIVPVTAEPWRDALRGTVHAARGVMLAHPWAMRALEARPATPAVLRHVDAVLGILRGGGFSRALSHHAVHLFGSRLLGFSHNLVEHDAERSAALLAQWGETLPHLAEFAGAGQTPDELVACDPDLEFEFTLVLLLQALEERRAAEAVAHTGAPR